MAYLLDADVFMQASNMFYGFGFCSAFWDWIDRENRAGRVFSLDRVLREILDGSDEPLNRWAKERPGLFLKSADEPTFSVLKDVGIWAKNNFEPAGYAKFFQGADFALVGYARAHGHVVVTQEVTGNSKAKIKLPDACDAFRVLHCNAWEMLAKEKANFALA